MDMNSIFLEGRLTKDAELRVCKDGETYLCIFSIACNRREKENGKWVNKVSYFNVNKFLSAYEKIINHLKKGVLVTLNGSMIQKEYLDKNGNKKQTWIVQANKLKLLQSFSNTLHKKDSYLDQTIIDEIYSPKKESQDVDFGQDEIPF